MTARSEAIRAALMNLLAAVESSTGPDFTVSNRMNAISAACIGARAALAATGEQLVKAIDEIATLRARVAEVERLWADDVEILKGDIQRRGEMLTRLESCVAEAEEARAALRREVVSTHNAAHAAGFREGVLAAAEYVTKWWGGGADAAKGIRALVPPPAKDGEGKPI